MQNRIVVQGRTKGDSPLTQVIAGAVAGGNLDRLDVAVAYATLSGLDELEKALGGFASTSRWLIGLDDAISQPAALDRIMATPGATLKVASFSKQGRRYHPKVYRLWSSADAAAGFMAVGSGNLTRHGLIENGEAGVFLSAETAADAQSLEHSWGRIWAMGNLPTPKDLTDYKLRYDAARKARAKLLKAGVVPLDPVIDEIDDEPALPVKTSAALTGWLDIGSATAQGREVEIPKLMWPFFKIGPNSPNRQLRVRLPNGQIVPLPLTEREDNGMWRIAFPSAIIQAFVGRATFRPVAGGNRSDLALILSKQSAPVDYAIDYTMVGSPGYAALVSRSTAIGTLRRTINGPAGRNFGFF